MKSLKIDENITNIGTDAFYSCSNITGITIPEGVEAIGEYAFMIVVVQVKLQYRKSVLNIGQYAFSGCKFTDVDLPDNLEVISDGMFITADIWSM